MIVKGSKFVCGDIAWFLKEMMVSEERGRWVKKEEV